MRGPDSGRDDDFATDQATKRSFPATLHLDAKGRLHQLSPVAETLFGRLGDSEAPRPPSDLLLDPSGEPLDAGFFQAFLNHPNLEPLRRNGVPLLAQSADGHQLAVRVIADADGSDGSQRLLLQDTGSTSQDTTAPPRRVLEAASEGRKVLIRQPGKGPVPLRRFCSLLAESGYPGVAFYRLGTEDGTPIFPLAWAHQRDSEQPQSPRPVPHSHGTNALWEALAGGEPVIGSCRPPWPHGQKEEAPYHEVWRCLALPVPSEGRTGPGILAVWLREGDEPGASERRILGELAGDLGTQLSTDGDQSPAAEGMGGELTGILEAAPDFLAVLGPEGSIRFLNSGGSHLLGGPDREAWEGRALSAFLSAKAARRFREEAVPEALAEGWWRGETVLLTVHGAEIPVDQTLVAHPGPGDQAHSLFTIIRDITQRKQEEARLRDSEEKYRRILEAAQEGFWIVHDQLRSDEPPQLRFKVPVSKGTRIALLDLPEVRYFQADGHYSQVFTGNGSYLCNLSVSDLERRLDPAQFVRIHRSYILNLEHARVLERMDEQWCVTVDREGDAAPLPVSRRNVEKLKALLGVG